MARKKSFFSKLRIRDEEDANLGKSLDDFEVDGDDEFDDEFEYVEEEQEIEVDDDEVADEFEDDDDLYEEVEDPDADLEVDADDEQDDLVSEYEGQLTIDVFQTPKEIIIKSTIAGVKPENVDISIDNDMVTVKGERTNEHTVSEEDYYYQECYWGAFSRSVILPVDVIADKAEAKLKNGILTLKLPKARQSKTKKIDVKAG